MVKKRKLPSAGRVVFIEMVLEMLDEGTALREMNLRQIARRIGCAHTNAYNYFASFEELLWWSLREALERMVGKNSTGEEEQRHEANLIESYVDFALAHPAWYRLIWMEALGGIPPRGVEEYLKVPGVLYQKWLAEHVGRDPDDPVLVSGARILHGYLHGELAAITTGRGHGTTEELKLQVLEQSDRLLDLLFY